MGNLFFTSFNYAQKASEKKQCCLKKMKIKKKNQRRDA